MIISSVFPLPATKLYCIDYGILEQRNMFDRRAKS